VNRLPQQREAARSTARRCRQTGLPLSPTGHRALSSTRRRISWTRVGRAMGFTNNPAKRAAIRTAMTNMIWVHPDAIADVLGATPLRFVVAALLRQGHLVTAATTQLSSSSSGIAFGLGSDPKLIGLQSDAQERYVLLDVGYEVVYVLRETLTVPHAAVDSPARVMRRDNETDREVR
jgi:hypothetical protein